MTKGIVLTAAFVFGLLASEGFAQVSTPIGTGAILPMGHPIPPMGNPVIPITNPVLPMGSSPVTGFGVMPTPFVVSAPVSTAVPVFAGGNSTVIVVNGGTVVTSGPVLIAPGTSVSNTAIVANTVVLTNTPMANKAGLAPAKPGAPQPARGLAGTANSPNSGRGSSDPRRGAPAPNTQRSNVQVHKVAPGTLRADVIRQLGAPLTSTFTRESETLIYSGGVTIVIIDGKVQSR